MNKKDCFKLCSIEITPLKELLIEQNLYDAGLSPVNSLDKLFCILLYLSNFELLVSHLVHLTGMKKVPIDKLWKATSKRKNPAKDHPKKAIAKCHA